MLHKDVRAAVKKRKFNIYPVQQVEDVMQLLSRLESGCPDASGSYPQKSFNYLVQQRIGKLQGLQKRYSRFGSDKDSAARSDAEK